MNTKLLKKMSIDGDLSVNFHLGLRIIIKSILSLIIVISLFIICNINKANISKLSIINLDVFFYVGIFFILFSIISLIYGIIITFDNNFLETKISYFVYSCHDILNFIIDIVYVFFFIISFILTPTTVSGNSMNNTLYNYDKLLVWHLGYEPVRDDIVIIDINESHYNNTIEEQFFIKRIVAINGDNVKFEYHDDNIVGSLYVNDTLVESSILYDNFYRLCSRYNSDLNLFESFIEYGETSCTIPSGYSVVMGDNRNNSLDSRRLGLIYNEDILGKAVFRYYSAVKGIGSIK